MAAHILCDGETLALLRFRYLARHLMTPDDFENISLSSTPHFKVQGC